ncbi:MAG: helix-turn-helix transcriptional regulator [Bacteroidales bacterium]|nr:MAG: helix-turn-helix transcriptional regulator [Bacteroidales bacterium]
MAESVPGITNTFHIKNMVSQCSIHLLKEKFEELNIRVNNIMLGQANLTYDPGQVTEKDIKTLLLKYGFELIMGREKQLVENIKISVIELVHQMNNMDSIIRKSDYLVEKLGMSYQYLSKVFSTNEGITLEKYIILQKIERIKELVYLDEYTLSEIAFMMDYSSVQYLSNQFRKITGFSVTEFKKNEIPLKKSIDRLH